MDLRLVTNFINKKKSENFTGCIKLSFQGKNSEIACNVSNAVDLPITKSANSENILERIKLQETFFGSVVIEYSKGEPVGYAYNEKVKL